MRDRILSAVEVLENMREGTEAYTQALYNLYIYSMGKYSLQTEQAVGPQSVFDNRRKANQIVNEVTTISFLCHNLSSKLSQLPEMVNPEKGHSQGEQLKLE
jgi:hypothetical protein